MHIFQAWHTHYNLSALIFQAGNLILVKPLTVHSRLEITIGTNEEKRRQDHFQQDFDSSGIS